MRVIILTSSSYGTAAHHLPYLLKSADYEIVMVVLSHQKNVSTKKRIIKIVKKIIKIGVLGALNGMRMRKWYSEDVKKYTPIQNLEFLCKQNNVPFFTTPTINCQQTVALFQQANADVGISLGNGYIEKKIFSIPVYDMINIHHEILPAYQNAQSIIWQLYNNSSNTGFTIHKIDQHIDRGEILFQSYIPIKFKDTLADTVANTSSLLLEGSAKGLVYVLSNFIRLFNTAKKQGAGETYTTPSFRQYLTIHSNFKRLQKKYQNQKK